MTATQIDARQLEATAEMLGTSLPAVAKTLRQMAVTELRAAALRVEQGTWDEIADAVEAARNLLASAVACEAALALKNGEEENAS